MAVIHKQRPRTQAERDVDAAITVAWSSYRALEPRLEQLGRQVVEVRQAATQAGILGGPGPLRSEPSRAPEPVPAGARRARRRLAARIALVRAGARTL